MLGEGVCLDVNRNFNGPTRPDHGSFFGATESSAPPSSHGSFFGATATKTADKATKTAATTTVATTTAATKTADKETKLSGATEKKDEKKIVIV
jgi:hypothetical protein